MPFLNVSGVQWLNTLSNQQVGRSFSGLFRNTFRTCPVHFMASHTFTPYINPLNGRTEWAVHASDYDFASEIARLFPLI